MRSSLQARKKYCDSAFIQASAATKPCYCCRVAARLSVKMIQKGSWRKRYLAEHRQRLTPPLFAALHIAIRVRILNSPDEGTGATSGGKSTDRGGRSC